MQTFVHVEKDEEEYRERLAFEREKASKQKFKQMSEEHIELAQTTGLSAQVIQLMAGNADDNGGEKDNDLTEEDVKKVKDRKKSKKRKRSKQVKKSRKHNQRYTNRKNDSESDDDRSRRKKKHLKKSHDE